MSYLLRTEHDEYFVFLEKPTKNYIKTSNGTFYSQEEYSIIRNEEKCIESCEQMFIESENIIYNWGDTSNSCEGINISKEVALYISDSILGLGESVEIECLESRG